MAATSTTTLENPSVADYRFDDEKADAIVRFVAYRPRDYQFSAIWFPSHAHAGVQPSIATPFRRDSATELGSLDRLPPELLHVTLSYLDMQSLLRFRQTCLRSRQILASLKAYRMVIQHGLNMLCALLRTGLATAVSLTDFYNVLCTDACNFCDNFGIFVSLLCWKRCCYRCLIKAPEVQVQSLDIIRRHFRLTRNELCQLKYFKTLPGTYTLSGSVIKTPITVASISDAVLICKRQPRQTASVQRVTYRRSQNFNFMAACALPYYDRLIGEVEHGLSCFGCQLAARESISKSNCEARDKVYSRENFLRHFRCCEQAHLVWRANGEGRRWPALLPEAVRRRVPKVCSY